MTTKLQNTLHHFGRDRTDWWLRFAEWIGVATGQDLIGLGSRRRSRALDSVTLWIDRPADGQKSGFSTLNLGDFRGSCGTPLTKVQLARCMALTADATRPPLARLLLRDARSLIRFDECRRVVLDAGTATELALTAMLDKHAAIANNPQVTAKVRKTKMLGPLLKLADELLPDKLPDKLWERVIEPRNGATHEGQVPTKEAAEKAISTTAELLDMAYPLSDFGLAVIPAV